MPRRWPYAKALCLILPLLVSESLVPRHEAQAREAWGIEQSEVDANHMRRARLFRTTESDRQRQPAERDAHVTEAALEFLRGRKEAVLVSLLALGISLMIGARLLRRHSARAR